MQELWYITVAISIYTVDATAQLKLPASTIVAHYNYIINNYYANTMHDCALHGIILMESIKVKIGL